MKAVAPVAVAVADDARELPGSPWRVGLVIGAVALVLRVAWVLCVPTIVVGDFATYRESALFLAEHGRLDDGFIYMPGLVLLLAGLDRLGGEVVAAKLLGAGFGALTAMALYVLARAAARPVRAVVGDGGAGSSAGAVGAGVAFLYLLWLPGLAMASVVGTDVPCAALICVALACLFEWGPRHPWRAAVAFGLAMGAAAWFRAVALPLVALGAGYWLAARAPLRAVVARTAVGVVVALVVLAPWAWRNLEVEGRLSFTDTHGGVTALMGNDPNTAGTYSRGLGETFRALTGRTFLARPHRETDRAAYALARTWMAFSPGFTVGMVAMRLERLLAPERGLLYWSVYRPGILPPEATLAFNQRRAWLTGLTDAFGWLLVLGLVAGVAFAVNERAFGVLVPLVFALAMLATYAIFVAEPRYRLTSEIVAFPVAAFGLTRLGGVARQMAWAVVGARFAPSSGRASPDEPAWLGFARPRDPIARGPLAGAAVAALVLGLGAGVIVVGGRLLREHTRWAFSVTMVNGVPRATYWRPVFTGTGRTNHFPSSPVQGGAGGPTIRAPLPAEPASTVEMFLPEVSPAGIERLTYRAQLEWLGPRRGGSSRAPDGEAASAPAPALFVAIARRGGTANLGAPASFATAHVGDRALEGKIQISGVGGTIDANHHGGLRLVLRLEAEASPRASAFGGTSFVPASPSPSASAPVAVRLSAVELTLQDDSQDLPR